MMSVSFIRFVGIFFFVLFSNSFYAQGQTLEDSVSTNTKKDLSVSGYIETYYIYDFNAPQNHQRPSFFYAYNRHNEVALNIGVVSLSINKERFRGNLSLMAGTYSNDNLAAERGVMKNVYEAYTGVKLSKTKNIWLDAGIFSSHIGFGSAIGQDCWNLTRSLVAENSPYYESGVKVTYTSTDEKWLFSGLLLNGWQRIRRLDGNQTLALGHQLTYKPNQNVLLNSSSFIGNDYPTDQKRMRYFHDFYAQIQLGSRFGMLTGFDIGAEQKEKNSTDYSLWYGPVVITKLDVSPKMSLATRLEYFYDKDEINVSTGTANGFQTIGYSINLDYKIMENVLWRLEARSLSSRDAIFIKDSKASNTNTFMGTSLALKL